MRDIKFRAWDRLRKEMFELKNCPLSELNETSVPVMQYTGLKDRNGKEIYEGDIVERICDMTNYGGYGISESEVYEVSWSGIDLLPFSETSIYTEEFKVLGNIHENPELLGG